MEGNPTSISKKLFDVTEECKCPIIPINRVTEFDI